MTSSRWKRIEEIYDAALEHAPVQRDDFLAHACGGDDSLRRDVEQLIAAHDTAGDFLGSPAWEAAASALLATRTRGDTVMSLVGGRIGAYEILAPLGAGGMGEVYRARDTKLNRDVALKVLPELLALDDDRLARFRREAHVLAWLNHPNIAAIYGLEAEGDVKALVLELVDGPTLADRIVRGRLPLDEALPIARQIADALEAAPPERDRSPRSEAREHQSARRRHGQSAGFRIGEGRGIAPDWQRPLPIAHHHESGGHS
jgi:serine/threonine protein kinase